MTSTLQDSTETFVIVGAGLAGAKAAQALRDQGFTGRLVMFGSEEYQPYERPALSKGFLMGSTDRAKVFALPADWYAEHNVELHLNVGVTSIDRAQRQVTTSSGDVVSYHRLLLTTGARSRRLAMPGADAEGVYYLRTLDESAALQSVLAEAQRLVVIGAGWIGLEVTAAARQAGVEVTVIETAELPLLRVLGREVAQVFAGLHIEHGVDFRFGAALAGIRTKDGKFTAVELGDGSVVEGDALLVAIGAVPNTELAEAAHLTVDNGVQVDAGMRTSDPDIFAAGDVANADNPVLGKSIRVEHWDNALHQPVVAATSMLGGEVAYSALPYFYTDQYDLGMEYVGYVEPGGYDQVVFRGDKDKREFIAYWLSGGRVVAGMNVNIWDVVEDTKALIASGLVVDPVQLADSSVSISSLIGPAKG